MKKVMTVLASLHLALATVIGAADVQYDFDPDADFSKYEDYAWAEDPSRPGLSELADKRLRSTIEAELAAKGLARVDSAADLLVVYRVAVEPELDISESWRGVRWGRELHVDTRDRGTLVLDIHAARSGELLWRGVVSKLLPEGKTDPEKQRKRVEKAVADLLESFPPR